jgi:hypothetical protein
MVVLQNVPSGNPAQVAGTFVLFALFFTLTAHLAARNVLGDVEVKNAFAVGPVIPAISFVFVSLGWPGLLAIPLALVADGLLFRYLYREPPRVAAYVTFIHVVVSIIIGVIVFGLLAIIRSAPG